MSDTTIKIAGLDFINPVIPASGTFGFGYEMAKFYDLNILGGISLKGTTLNERFGNETPRIADCASGLINAIGLQNPGVKAVVVEELPKLRKLFGGHLLANISGFSIEEYSEVAAEFDRTDVSIIEVNISCPNVRHGGMSFGTSPEAAAEVTREVKKMTDKPVFVKLSPNVTDIAEIAKAVEAAGADGLVLINTLLGMRIEPRTGRPVIANKTGGFSGPAIKPVAVRMVYDVYKAVKIPIIGVGGIASADDVLEFMSAGASLVEVGAENLVNPYACRDIIDELPLKMKRYGIGNLTGIIGRSHKF